MTDLSLYILDLSYNSIEAGSTKIAIEIEEDIYKNILRITIEDNGRGMSEQEVLQVTNPFYTTRTTRDVGLGIPLFKQLCELCGGQEFSIISNPNQGTTIRGTMSYDSIDLPPLGDIVQTIKILLMNEIDIDYRHSFNNKEFVFSTIQIKEQLGSISFTQNEIRHWLENYLNNNLKDIRR